MLTHHKLPVAGIVAALVVALSVVVAPAAGARVLRVGTFHGIRGQYTSIQTAVNAAAPGDWILVAPGDYKTSSSSRSQGGGRYARRRPDHHAAHPRARDEPEHGGRRRHQAGLTPLQ